MINKKGFEILGLSIFLFMIFSAGLTYFILNEKSYNGVLLSYISNDIAGEYDRAEDKISALRAFVHLNINPVSGSNETSNTVGVEKLISGIGWCDQISRVFMQLAKEQGITTRLLFLKDEGGSSPHSVAEALIDGKWVVVDATYNIDFRTKYGDMASMSDIREDFSIVTDNDTVKKFGLYNEIWKSNDFLSMYSRDPQYVITKKGKRAVIFKYIPKPLQYVLARFIQEIYIFKNRDLFQDPMELSFYRARSYHLLGNKKKAEELYRYIIDKGDNDFLEAKTHFFLGTLLISSDYSEEALNVLNKIINRLREQKRIDNEYSRVYDYYKPNLSTNWLSFILSLRYIVYKDIGDEVMAHNDFMECAKNPNAYF